MLKGMGKTANKTKVERLLKKNGIKARTKRKFRVTTETKHNLPVAPNILERNFSPEKPNQIWASDITYVWIKEGGNYIRFVLPPDCWLELREDNDQGPCLFSSQTGLFSTQT